MNDTNFLNAEPCSDERALPPKNLINAAELVRRQWRPHGWLLWQMVPRSGITLLAGETASGKSFLGLDLALGMASGRGRAWDMEIGAGIREQGSGNSRERAPRVPNDANLMQNGTSRIPYEDPSQAQDDKNICRERPLGVPDKGDAQKGTEWSVPTCPGSEADRVPYKDPYAVHFVSQAQDDRCTEPLYRATRDQGSGNSKEKYFPISHQLSTMSREARVRYFCADADPNLIAERVLRLCRGYPTSTYGGTIAKNSTGTDVPPTLDFDFAAHQFTDPQSFRWLQKEIDRQGYQLLIFDGLAQYLPAMADGSAPAVGTFLRGLRQLASQTGVTILLIHQFNKRLASRSDKYGMPISQGEDRIRGSSELLAGVDTALLLSRPEASALGVRAQTLLRVVKNRLGQSGARLRFSIADGDESLHLLFERPADPTPLKPRRLVDAAFDEMMRILMRHDRQKFTRAELTKQLQQRMDLPTTRSLTEAFRLLGKEEQVRVERDQSGKKHYSWATPGTGEMANITYGLPPVMAFDLGSRWAWSKTQQLILRAEVEKMEGNDENSELVEKLAAFIKEQEAEEKKADSL